MSFVLYFFYLPLVKVLGFLLSPFSFVKKRKAFEIKNKTESGARSFKLDHTHADFCFEFSSEGEFQQVAPLIQDLLDEGKKLELVFFSPSVEEQILKLEAKYQSQIRYLRYPVFSLGFSSWITSKKLVLVRYDFFPEFLVWAKKKDHSLIILLASFKKERSLQKVPGTFKQLFLKTAKKVVYATPQDLDLAKSLGLAGEVFDFRAVQIKRRLEKKDEHFKANFKNFSYLESFIKDAPLIIGNAWPVDIELLKDIPNTVKVLIVPHKLSEEVFDEMKASLSKMNRSVEIFDNTTTSGPEASTVILNKKGVLCELYSNFSMSYVGGGLGVSVHSILEPLLAGSSKISSGPVHYRSTEFEWALHYKRMTEVKDAKAFFEWFSQNPVKENENFNALASQEAYDKLKRVLFND